MYNFTDITQKGSKLLPKEAVNIDGFFLDREIASFTTLTIDGRETINVSMDNYPIPKTDGVKVRNRNLKERTIKVYFSFQARSIEEYYSDLRKLKKHIYKQTPLKIFFDDEKNIYYEGYLSSLTNMDTNYIHSSGSFEILCPKPYKYHVNSKQNISNNGKINLDTARPLRIRTVEIPLINYNNTTMIIKIGNYTMKLVGLPTTSNKELKINFEELTITLGGQNINSNLDIFSDFGNIRVQDRDIFSCNLLSNNSKIIVDVEVYDL
ncbi:TPA: distal tail protein Dit [Enterococcus faecalis]